MIDFSLETIQNITQTNRIGLGNVLVSQLYFDTRHIVATENAMYIALKNNQFVQDAYQKGIRNFLCFPDVCIEKDANYLLSEQPLQSLQVWAKYHRNSFSIPIFGITGSNGKTIVKEWLSFLLQEEYHVVRNPKSYNSQLGLPLSVLEIQDQHTIGIFEAGISEVGEMSVLENILKPTIGILTNIGTAHIEHFDSSEQLLHEKMLLFADCKTIVIPFQLASKFKNHSQRIITFGKDHNATVSFQKIEKSDEGFWLYILYNQEALRFEIPFQDEISIQNILCVIAALVSLDVDLKRFIPFFKLLEPIEMRLELKKGIQNTTLINDTFNADELSIKAALDVLNQQNKEKILVLSELQLSQQHEQQSYHEISKLVNSQSIDEVFLVGDRIGAYSHEFTNCKKTFSNTQEAIDYFSHKNIENKAILIKGARSFRLDALSKRLELQKHDTILEVNLHSLMSNVNYFKSKLKATTKLMAMVKANAYGMGIVEVAEILQHYHIDYLGVAYADEGALLREKGIHVPIMVMNPEQSSFDTIVENQLEPEIYSIRVLQKFIKTLQSKSITQTYPIHIKIDSGMHRLGFSEEQIPELIRILEKHSQLEVKSIFSHLAVSDEPNNDYNKHQFETFIQSSQRIENALQIKPIRHILNSSGISNFADYQFDMVRLGIGMYGDSADSQTQKYLATVASLKTVISQFIELEEGESVGYGRRFIATQKTKIATLPIGYADGIPRLISRNDAYVNISGFPAKIVGSICMDMLMCDVTNIECSEGDEVVLFGTNPTISDFAKWSETISYECFTSISPRVKRIYFRE